MGNEKEADDPLDSDEKDEAVCNDPKNNQYLTAQAKYRHLLPPCPGLGGLAGVLRRFASLKVVASGWAMELRRLKASKSNGGM